MEDIKWRSDSEIFAQIGQKIKEWRLESNMSQKQLAEESGLSQFTVQQMEYGNGSSLGSMMRIMRVLDRLDFFALFFEKKRVSPIEAAKMKTPYRRRRAAKRKIHDKDTDNKPLW